jgi:peptidoglycan hydrolase CwlO-like protein
MLTKLITSMLALFIAGIICFSYTGVQKPITTEYVSIPSADSSIKKVVDSTKSIREEFIMQKDSIRDKVEFLQWQQKQIRETQRKIDSIQVEHTMSVALQFIRTISGY